MDAGIVAVAGDDPTAAAVRSAAAAGESATFLRLEVGGRWCKKPPNSFVTTLGFERRLVSKWLKTFN